MAFGNAITGDVVNAGAVAVNTAGNLSTSGKLKAGSYSGIASVGTALTGVDAGNYSFAGATGNYVVNKASASAVIAAGASVYGAALAPGAVSLAGLLGGDVVNTAGAVVATAGNLSTSGKLKAGTYGSAETLASPALSGTDAGNYALANPAVTGSYSVSKLALGGSIAAGASDYGAALAPGAVALTGQVSGDVVNAGAVAVNTAGNLSTSGKLNAGSYSGIESVGTALTGVDAGNYSFAGAVGNYVATPASLTITYTATPSTSIYGTTPLVGGSTSAVGLVSGDQLTGSAVFATNGTTKSNIASYGVTGSGLGASANYTLINAQAATNASALTITPRALSITADPQSRLVGLANPALTYMVGTATATTGLVIGDALTGSLATVANPASAVGLYAINLGSVAASVNYVIIYVGAFLNVKPPLQQSLTTFIGGTPVTSTPLSQPACAPAAVSQTLIQNGQTVITNSAGGGGCGQ